MKTREASQLILSPEDSPETVAAAMAALDKDQEYLTGWVAAKIRFSRLLHPLGIHHWVQYRTFDVGSDRIIEWSGRWVCLWCPRGKIE